MQTIYLDISNKGVVPTIYAKQGDVGRTFSIILTDAGVPYNVPSGSVFSAWYSGKSGSGNYTDIGADSAFSVNDNSVTVEMISQMLQIPGDGILCIVLSKSNGDQIGMWNIPYVCEKVPGYGSATAEDYFTAFSQAVENLPYPDLTLSAPGKAADAAAVGEALEGKAPAGYGLGTTAIYKVITTSSELDTFINNGWYAIDCTNKLTVTGLSFQHFTMLVSSYNQDHTHQELWVCGNDFHLCRDKKTGVWSEWEWENPPMVIGVEYQTTERHNGKSVFVKAVELNLAGSGFKSVYVAAGITEVVSMEGSYYQSWGGVLSEKTVNPSAVQLNLANGSLQINSGDMSGTTAKYIVKYTYPQ